MKCLCLQSNLSAYQQECFRDKCIHYFYKLYDFWRHESRLKIQYFYRDLLYCLPVYLCIIASNHVAELLHSSMEDRENPWPLTHPHQGSLSSQPEITFFPKILAIHLPYVKYCIVLMCDSTPAIFALKEQKEENNKQLDPMIWLAVITSNFFYTYL